MPTELDHVRLANRNHDALFALVEDPGRFSEWIATIAFYKAIHVVEAVLDHSANQHSGSHEDRFDKLRVFCAKNPDAGPMFRNLRWLHRESRLARYLEFGSNRVSDYESHQPADGIVKRAVRKRLKPLEQTAKRFLSETAWRELVLVPDSMPGSAGDGGMSSPD